MLSFFTIHDEIRAFCIIGQQQSRTSRTGKRAIQLAGSAVEGSLDSAPGQRPSAVAIGFSAALDCVVICLNTFVGVMLLQRIKQTAPQGKTA
jgi:hypothetical protein